MRREGYELAVSQAARRVPPRGRRRAARADRARHRRRRGPAPGRRHAGARRAQAPTSSTWSRTATGRVRLEYRIPARGLIGFQNEFLNLTRGTGLISNIFDSYEPYKGEIEARKNGVLISQDDGEAVTYALGKLDDRGRMFVKAGRPALRGHDRSASTARDNDLVVNAVRGQAADQLPRLAARKTRSRSRRRSSSRSSTRSSSSTTTSWSRSRRSRSACASAT